MIVNRGPTIIELDRQASTHEAPYGIITADCSDPREIDDGIFVEELPTNREMYRVGVCVADTSSLFNNNDVFEQAMKRTAARYWDLQGDERGYDPMIDKGLIRDLEFKKGNVRDALIVSFVVGKTEAPTDVDIKFGKVEVTENLSYQDFALRYASEAASRKFSRASAFIIKHLQYVSGGDYDSPVHAGTNPERIYNRLTLGTSEGIWSRGSKANESFMIAANHLVGRTLDQEGRPAVYRVHDPDDERYINFLPPDMATYDTKPGVHKGLNLSHYCRVTSPLRRLEDFVMSYQLHQRFIGQQPTQRDERLVAAAVQRLNQYTAQELFQGPIRTSRQDTLGARRRAQHSDPEGHKVIPIRRGSHQRSIA
jgi:exoribonuclease R